MSLVRVIRRKRALALTGAAVLATAGTGLLFGPQAHAATGSSNQTITFTPSALLTITALPVALGSATPSSNLPVSLGSVIVTDNQGSAPLASPTPWTATVAASNCFPATVQTTGTATNVLPSTALTLNAGPAATPVSLSAHPVSSTPGTGGAFDATVGGTGGIGSWTYSDQQTLATAAPTGGDASSNNGTYTLTPSVSLNLTGTSGFLPVASLYTCSLQYSVTG